MRRVDESSPEVSSPSPASSSPGDGLMMAVEAPSSGADGAFILNATSCMELDSSSSSSSSRETDPAAMRLLADDEMEALFSGADSNEITIDDTTFCRSVSSGWLRTLSDVLRLGSLPVSSGSGHGAVPTDTSGGSTSPPSRASRKRPLSPPPPLEHQTTPLGESSTAWHAGMPRRVAHVFSGPGQRADGLKQFALLLYGLDVVEYDTIIDEVEGNILDDVVFYDLLARIASGEFAVVIIGTPCGTFSVARIPKYGISDGGPEQLRDKENPTGIPDLSERNQQIVEDSNTLVARSVALARATQAAGGSFIIENPATRSDSSSDLYRWIWRSHASLWMHPEVDALAAEAWSHMVTFPQCALGGEYQKWTSLLFSSDLLPVIGPLANLKCTHARHKKQAVGKDEEGKWRSAQAAAYPAEMNARLAAACASKLLKARLRVGSRRPHADEQSATDADVGAKFERYSSSSLRRLEPEVERVLLHELLPEANAPPVTEWADAPPGDADAPGPFTTAQLIPEEMQFKLLQFAQDVKSCMMAARQGRWRWARDHRPAPLHATEDECVHACGRGWIWAYNDSDSLWHAVQPSSWPDSPPSGELDAAMFIQYAKEAGFPDKEIISYIAHGYPGPDLPRCAVLGPPHVGALKEMAAFDKTSAKDRAKGWVKSGYRLPPFWPMRADPMNIVIRNGKPRMTIDKTMQLIYGVASYNDCIDLDVMPAIEYVSVAMLGRAVAIMQTAGVDVRLWGFDLEAYFRKTGKQRAHIWMSGFVHADGYGADERVQFGQREAPVLCGRQSCFLMFAVRRELQRFDDEHPVVDEKILRWVAARKSSLTASERGQEDTYAGLSASWRQWALSFCLMYVDDVGAVSFNDLVYNKAGQPVMGVIGGVYQQMRRAHWHLQVALRVVAQFGHVDSIEKRCLPDREMVFLGVTIDVVNRVMYLSKEKANDYRLQVLDVLESRVQDNGTILVQPALISSLTHKLIHAATVVPLGRQHLFHILRALKQDAAIKNGAKVLGRGALVELRWWAATLQLDAVRHGVPLASRTAFPAPSDPHVLAPYSDASREHGSADSGYGAWAVIEDTFYFVEGRWNEKEVAMLDINTLELVAMNIGSFTFLREAKRRGLHITHLFEFTDNTAAEHSVDKGKPKAERLGELVARRYESLLASNIFGTAERIASVDNDIADGLSRGGDQLAEALRLAAATMMPVVRLEADAEWRDTSYLFSLESSTSSNASHLGME